MMIEAGLILIILSSVLFGHRFSTKYRLIKNKKVKA